MSINISESLDTNTSAATHKLHVPWTLWFHSSELDNWSIDSYEKLVTIETVEEFWLVFNNFHTFTNGMYYLMRQGHLPKWEEYTKPIHFLKYLVEKRQYLDLWMTLCKALIGETLLADVSSDQVVGIGLSPKFKNLIISLWTYCDTEPKINPDLPVDREKTIFK